MNLRAPNFFGTVNQLLEYGIIKGSNIPICIFSFSKVTNLGSKALGTRIGFKSHTTSGTVNMTIGVGCTHPIISGNEAKTLTCLESMSQNIFFSCSFKNLSAPIFSLAIVSSINLCPIVLVSFILDSFLAC
jgi:hypothetical protein